ncbi:UDP-N-acetylmuramoyl-L-alanine--D-glutamate ligase [Brevibacillus sp. SYP-B805]|uniref:UDP-N-acetylmuramoyl-L-alanine--D-glutamate ligase n=1 Tax=Brevibacillus sp. SYP-B805 TaxID=1578199 RepID=UPI0013ED0F60|nr:UDP-N-acetylmuramoyl-L-alanine--D-glutamate ligase [Brevibacillus sp. SYP-B805]NGQ93716.1 UDP-N-acetylmuramoyl-L-alanine--D-glutamate ligase [Brevibacillus sp. SYP-B805]
MEQYRNRLVVVLGLAKSGAAVAKLLHRFGAQVVVNDKKPREEAAEAEELEALGIPVISGHHPDDLIHPGVDLVVKNPGIPYETPPVAKALALGIPVITEVELAYQLSKAPIIGITGSNGKTTTTTLVGLILQQAGIDASVGGNIGTVLCSLAETVREDQLLVAELSSFQLMGTSRFRPHIGALLNLYPAHLDYHHSQEAYLAAKLKLFANQTADDIAILPYDQPDVLAKIPPLPAKTYYFSKTAEVRPGVFVRDGMILFAGDDGTTEEVMPVAKLSIPHVENALAAILITRLAGADYASMAHVLSTFPGVEHRLEYVATVQGVRYYNDSKATNPEAASRAIQAFAEPVVLIAGGLDRGIDFRELVPVFRKHVKALVAYGQTADILLARAEEAGIRERFRVDTVEKAVFAAADLAAPGDVVLLSPACASWDMFPSFEVRGHSFKDGVHRLRTSLA